MSTKGFSSNKKLKSKDGESIQRYATMQPAGAGKTGLDMLPKAVFEKLADLIPEVGSTKDTIVLAGNTAKEGDLIRFTAGPLQGEEVTVLDSDGTTIELSHIFDSVITVADVFAIHGYLTLTVSPTGSLETTAGPLLINRGPNGVFVEVGITKDTANPAGTVPLPVEIVAVDGTTINITAGDINIQSTDLGANFDAMRTGDGSGNYMAISADQEAQVHDPKVLLKLSDLATEATVATLATEATVATLATETTVATLATETTVATLATETTVATLATEATVATLATEATVATLATETTQAAMSAKLPLTLGSKLDAASLAVTQSTEDKATQNDIKSAIEAIAADSVDTTEDHYKRDFDTTPLTAASSWVVLRTLTAAIKRVSITNNSGNELLIRNQATAKTIIVGAGATVNTSLIGAIADVIEISAIADTDGGIIYLNFEG